MTDDRPRHLLVAGAFLLIALVQTWPLVTSLSHVLPNDLGDPVFNAWILWWNAHAVPLTAHWWNAPIFFPSPGAMAFSETLLGESLLATPLQWIGASGITAYNVLFLLSFPLNAFCAYLLTWSLTRRLGPSIIAGVMFGFAMMRYAQVAHLQFQWTFWMPLALLGLHWWLGERRVGALLLFGVAWLGQALSNGYFFFYFSVIVGLWLAWFTRWRDFRRTLLPVLAIWAVGVAMMAPVLIGYQRVQERYRFTRSIDEIEGFSADLSDFFRVSSVPRFLHVDRWERPECEVSLPMVGLCALAAAVIAGARGGLRRRGPRSIALAHALAWAVALVLVLIIVGGLVSGSRQVRVPRLMVTAVPLVLATLAFSPTVERAWRERSPVAFYLAGVVVAVVMAMGPFPRAFRMRIWDHSPYLALMSIVPGFTGLRVPARFTLLAVLCLAVLTGLMLARVRFSNVWRERAVFGAILVACLFETWPGWFRLPELPPAGPDLTTASTVLELPLTHPQGVNAMFRQMQHGRPIINGYSGYFPQAQDLLALCFVREDLECVDRLRRVVGSLDVMIERAQDPDGRWDRVARAIPGAEARVRDAQFVVYRVPTPATRLQSGPDALASVRARAMTSTASAPDASRAIDGDVTTVWSTGRGQAANDSVTIELSDAVPVAGVELQSGSNAQNYPVALRVELSADGQRWSTAWEGPTADPRFATVLLEGVDGCRITFAARPARFVRLTETVDDSARPWSIAEVSVLQGS